MSRNQPPEGSAPTERFTRRADAYRRFRPGYPPALVDAILAAAPQNRRGAPRLLVDVGSGTGLSAEPFLQRGCRVYGVEPNEAMRAAGEEALADWPSFSSVAAAAEATGLPGGVAQVIIAGQALHWFRLDAARREVARIAAPGAVLALFWNTRDAGASPFMAGYNALVERHATDFRQVYHGNVTDAQIQTLYDAPVQALHFQWQQPLSWEHLEGRTRSSSYLPDSGPALEQLRSDLQALFTAHAGNGSVAMHYRSELWLGPAPRAAA